MANSVDPDDQLVSSGYTLFAKPIFRPEELKGVIKTIDRIISREQTACKYIIFILL